MKLRHISKLCTHEPAPQMTLHKKRRKKEERRNYFRLPLTSTTVRSSAPKCCLRLQQSDMLTLSRGSVWARRYLRGNNVQWNRVLWSEELVFSLFFFFLWKSRWIIKRRWKACILALLTVFLRVRQDTLQTKFISAACSVSAVSLFQLLQTAHNQR